MKGLKHLFLLSILFISIFFITSVNAESVYFDMNGPCANFSSKYYKYVESREQTGSTGIWLFLAKVDGVKYESFCTQRGVPLQKPGTYSYSVSEKSNLDPTSDLHKALVYAGTETGVEYGSGADLSCTASRIATQLLVHLIGSPTKTKKGQWKTLNSINGLITSPNSQKTSITKADISKEFFTIRSKILLHDKIPSFASTSKTAKTYKLKYDESKHLWSTTLTDSKTYKSGASTKSSILSAQTIKVESGTATTSLTSNKTKLNVSTKSDSQSIRISFSRNQKTGGEILTLTSKGYQNQITYKKTGSKTEKIISYVNLTPEAIGKGTIKVKKTNSLTNGNISGVTFGLYSNSGCTSAAVDYQGNSLAKKTTDANGEVSWSNLYYPSGGSATYYVKEETAPAGYETGELGKCKAVTINSSSTTLSVVNEPKGTGTISVQKKNSLSDTNVSGVTFGIYSDSACATKATDVNNTTLEAQTTGDTGTVTWNNLYYPVATTASKTYYVKEISVPPEYEKDEVGKCISVPLKTSGSSIGATVTKTITVKNIPKGRAKITVEKKDSYTEKNVSGVTFGIYSDSTCTTKATDYKGTELKDQTTGDTGIITWNNLYYPVATTASKTYYVKEISVPPEYETDEVGKCKPIIVKEVGQQGPETKEITYSVRNIPKGIGKIKIHKTNKYTGENLANATFGIYTDASCTTRATDYKGTIIEDKTTDENGEILWENLYYPVTKELEGGKYYLKEKFPPGFREDVLQMEELGAKNNCIPYQLKPADEDVGLNNEVTGGLYNVPYGNITILKQDDETGEVIAGVEFKLLKDNKDKDPALDIENNIVKNVITNENGLAEFEDIPYGDYILEEVKANDWYKILEEPLHFTLNKENDALKFAREGTEAVPDENELIIPPEKYRLGDPTDDGKINNDDLKIIEQIIAEEIEETPLQFYASDLNKDLKVDETDKDLMTKYIEGDTSVFEGLKEEIIPGEYQKRVTLSITNKPIDMKISKQSITTKKELPGATIEIKNSQGEIFIKYKSTTHPKEFNIPIGDYTLTEKVAPKGYQELKTTIKFRVLTDGSTKILGAKSNLYKVDRSKEDKDTDLDHLKIFNEVKKIIVPDTGSVITISSIIIGTLLIGGGGYFIIKRYRIE